MKVFTSLLTAGRVFGAMVVALLICFLWSGSESAMTRMGMETKTSLRTALAIQTQAVQTANKVNLSNAATIKQLEDDKRSLVKELTELKRKDEKVHQTVTQVQTSLSKKIEPIKAQIAKKKTVTQDSVTLPLAEINAKSEANINAIQEAYDKFFAGVDDENTVSLTTPA